MLKNTEKWSVADIQSFTFVVTQNCNLACKYCYETGKNNKSKMSKELAYKAADFLIDKCSSLSSVIIDFIGGEPLLEVDLIDEICDYIKFRLYEEGHHWFGNYEITLTTNGTLYDRPQVQKFIKKNQNMLAIGISLDGTKEKHDAQRVHIDGTGSYEDVVKNVPLWLSQFPDGGTKLTFSSSDLKYIKDSVIHVHDLGIKYSIANIVNEDVWEDGDEVIFEEQLKELADYMLQNNLETNYAGGFFNEMIGRPFDEERLKLNWCNCGENNLAVDNRGFLYPCIRFLPFTLGNKSDRNIGNIFDGIDRNKLRAFECLNFETQCSEQCLKCPVADGCQWCVGNNYSASENNTIFDRSEAICKMHKANCRANDYYFAKLRNKKGYLRRILNIDRKRYLYILTEDKSVHFCIDNIQEIKGEHRLTKNNLKKALLYARNEFLTPVLVYGENDIDTEMKDMIDEFEWKAIKPVSFKGNFEIADIVVTTINNIAIGNLPAVNCVVLKCNINELHLLEQAIAQILEKAWKISLIIEGMQDNNSGIYDQYGQVLDNISQLLLTYYRKALWKQVDVITDTLLLTKDNHCNAGISSYTFAPDGEIYVCPNFYYDRLNGIIPDLLPSKEYLDKSKASGCKICDVYHCRRCIYENYQHTNEYPVPPIEVCKLRHIEREAGRKLQKQLVEEGIISPFERHVLKEIDYNDPYQVIMNEKTSQYTCK